MSMVMAMEKGLDDDGGAVVLRFNEEEDTNPQKVHLMSEVNLRKQVANNNKGTQVLLACPVLAFQKGNM